MLSAAVSLIVVLAAAYAVTKLGGTLTLVLIAAALFVTYRRLSLLAASITFPADAKT